ncbi:MAG TPA: TolC family protein [Puia sp.]|jgi:outer membrane protein TolC|nr:TolC family protein [Puia sp.]
MQKSIILLLLFLIGQAKARSQATLKLDDILSAIAASHPSVKMYDADIRSSDEAVKGARSWDAPELGTGLWMTPYNPSQWKRNADGSTGLGQYMISARQMIPNKKELDANEKYLRAVSAAGKESKQASLNELYAAAKMSYYNWLITERKLKVLDDNEKLLHFMIQSTEIRFKNNLGKLNAYYKAKAALGDLENQRILLQNEIVQQQVRLNTLMNRDTHGTFAIDTSYTIKDYSPADSSYFGQARSDIKAIQKNIELTYLQQNLERTRLKPQFGVEYDHMFGFGGQPLQYTLMATVRLPMAAWSARKTKASIESLKWKAEALDQQKQVMINEATGQMQGLLAAITSKKRQVTLFEQNIIPALQKNYQVLQLGYEQNTSDLFELLDAWQTLNMTQMEHLQQVQELLTLQTEMDKTLQQN